MFLPSVCEWIGECDKCWKALRAVSRLQKGAIEMQICYHLVEPWLKSTLEEILENRRSLTFTWPKHHSIFMAAPEDWESRAFCHITRSVMNCVTSCWRTWVGRFITILLSPCSPSAWRRKNWDFHGHFAKVHLFSWTDRQFINRKSITFETLFCLIVSEFFILL